MSRDKDVNCFMKVNYTIMLETYDDNGALRFGLQIPDLKGVWADGKTIEEAYCNLMETKKVWFETYIEKEKSIPKPSFIVPNSITSFQESLNPE